MVKINKNTTLSLHNHTFLLTGQKSKRDVSASSKEFVGVSEATYGAKEQGWTC